MISSKIFGERCTSNGVVPGHIVQEKLKKNKKWKEGEVGFRGFEKLIWMARDHGVGLIVVVCTKLISFTTWGVGLNCICIHAMALIKIATKFDTGHGMWHAAMHVKSVLSWVNAIHVTSHVFLFYLLGCLHTLKESKLNKDGLIRDIKKSEISECLCLTGMDISII